jgi:preprotein translocase subunit SecA
MRIFQGERIAALMNRLGVDEDTPIQNKAVSKTLEAAQKRVEGYHFDTRKNVVQYDNVINRHRRVVYTMRRKILEGDDIKPEIERLMNELVRDMTLLPAKNNKRFYDEFRAIIPVDEAKLKKIGEEKKDRARTEAGQKLAKSFYDKKEKEITPELLRKVERDVYLQVLDTLWMQHLENMQHLRDGIHWRSVGQRDPLVEYRSESQKLFDGLQATLREEVIKAVMHVHKHDAAASRPEDHETELTRLAERSVERGVNDVDSGESNRDDDFKVTKIKSASETNKAKNSARKKKKTQRQNKKKARR